MKLDTDRSPKHVKPGDAVYFSYQRTGYSMYPGMVVAQKGRKLIAVFPGKYRTGNGGEDAFCKENRCVFTWRPKRKLWAEEGDSGTDPMVASLWFPEDVARKAVLSFWIRPSTAYPDGYGGLLSPRNVAEFWDIRSASWRKDLG